MNTHWQAAREGWLASLRAAGRRPTTIKQRTYQIGRLADAMSPVGPWGVTGEDLECWLGNQCWPSNETLRSFRSAVRSFYRWGHGKGYVALDPAFGLPSVKPNDPNPRPTPEDAYRLALARADDRVRLMLRLAAELGMRRAEVAVAHHNDLERDLTGWTLRVHGKGGKIRPLPLTDGQAAAIRRSEPLGGWLFPGRVDGHLSPHYVGKLVSRSLPEAWAMHSLRHRALTAAYSVDRDLLTVQAMAGHASVETTRRYVKLPNDSLRRTMGAVASF